MKNLFRALLVICLFSAAGVTAQTLDFAHTINFGAIGTVRDMAIQPDNKIVLFAPCNSINWGNVPFCGIRLNEDGSSDLTFRSSSTSSAVFTFPNGASAVSDVEVQKDGKIVAVGYGSGAGLVCV